MRIRPLLLFAPVVFAGTLLLAAPSAVLADGGFTETGNTTYEVDSVHDLIKVTISLSIYNGKPDTTTSGGIIYYYLDNTEIVVENEAGTVSATSNAGGVSQSTLKSDNYYRYVKLGFPAVRYGQTRTITASYTIAASPHAPGNFRAGQSYASLCAAGNGFDTGSVSVVLPTGFEMFVDGGDDLTQGPNTADGRQVWTSGTQANPYKFWTCVDAENPTNLTHTSIVSSGQNFDIESWPEDPTWSASIRDYVSADVQRLETLTGLSMPGGTIQVREAGDFQLGNYGGTYNSTTTTADIPETIRKDTVAHELSHIWFNRQLLKDKWMSEGLAGYSEQAAGPGNFIECKDPGTYPGSGSPDLTNWQLLSNASTVTQQDISDWQYSASCYIFTTLAADMGPDNFRAVMKAVVAGEMPYIGATPGEKMTGLTLPMGSRQLLDLIDERGMLPAGADADTAGSLLAGYGIFMSSELDSRSTSRATYQALVASAGQWHLPLAIRGPMTMWSFDQADTAMDSAKQILDTRDSIEKQLGDFSLDGTTIQKQFESAATQTDLDSLLTLIKKEADAATKVDQAAKLKGSSRSFFQTIGLLGADIETPLKQARTDLTDIKPDSATTNAQTEIDLIDKSAEQGTIRIAAVVGTVVLLLLLIALAILMRRRRRNARYAMATPMPGWAPQQPGWVPQQPGWAQPLYPSGPAAPWDATAPATDEAPAPWAATPEPTAPDPAPPFVEPEGPQPLWPETPQPVWPDDTPGGNGPE